MFVAKTMTGLPSALQDGMNIEWKKAFESLNTTWLHMASHTQVYRCFGCHAERPICVSCFTCRVHYSLWWDLVLQEGTFNVELKKMLIDDTDTVYIYTKQ